MWRLNKLTWLYSSTTQIIRILWLRLILVCIQSHVDRYRDYHSAPGGPLFAWLGYKTRIRIYTPLVLEGAGHPSRVHNRLIWSHKPMVNILYWVFCSPQNSINGVKFLQYVFWIHCLFTHLHHIYAILSWMLRIIITYFQRGKATSRSVQRVKKPLDPQVCKRSSTIYLE